LRSAWHSSTEILFVTDDLRSRRQITVTVSLLPPKFGTQILFVTGLTATAQGSVPVLTT
jgi:hypothetical protein